MGFENEAEQSFSRPCHQSDGRSKRTCDLASSIVPRGTSFPPRGGAQAVSAWVKSRHMQCNTECPPYPESDIKCDIWNVRYEPKADILSACNGKLTATWRPQWNNSDRVWSPASACQILQ